MSASRSSHAALGRFVVMLGSGWLMIVQDVRESFAAVLQCPLDRPQRPPGDLGDLVYLIAFHAELDDPPQEWRQARERFFGDQSQERPTRLHVRVFLGERRGVEALDPPGPADVALGGPVERGAGPNLIQRDDEEELPEVFARRN